jgi:AcrR family transcriptional regulator
MSGAEAAKVAVEELPLRLAQKNLTRRRIRDAARELFFQVGYSGTTVEQIAARSGASRATFYLHFKDKAEVLKDIAEDYTPRAVEVMRRFPGPRPDLAGIRAWIGEFAELMKAEQASVLVFRQMGTTAAPAPEQVTGIADHIIAALGESSPAFRAALEPGPVQVEARARADLLLIEAVIVCGRAAAEMDPYAAAALDVLAGHFADFLDAPCFEGLSAPSAPSRDAG